jgi:hypothetical protein
MRRLPNEQEGCQKDAQADSANLLGFPNKNPKLLATFSRI